MRRHKSRLAGPAAPRRRAGTFTEAGPKGSRREEPHGEIKILDTLVEVPGSSASDAGSTPAASTTIPRPGPGSGNGTLRWLLDRRSAPPVRVTRPWASHHQRARLRIGTSGRIRKY